MPTDRRLLAKPKSLRAGARLPALVFASAWVAALVVLVASGQGEPVAQALIAAGYLALAGITIRITQDAPFARLRTDRRRHSPTSSCP